MVPLWGLNHIARSLGHIAPGALAFGLALVLALDLSGFIGRIAGNRTVPAGLVSGNGWQAGVVWGSALGSGVVVEAPYGLIHASLLFAVLVPVTWPVLAVPLLFASGRLLVILNNRIRRTVINGMDKFIRVGGRELPASLLVARVSSRAILFLATLVAVAGVFHER